MKRADAIKYLDQLQDCLLRSEEAHKDLDLLVALRICYFLLEERIRIDGLVEDAKKYLEENYKPEASDGKDI